VHGAGQLLSMGYGFVEYKTPSAAKEALKILQHTKLDGHQLELKMSNRTTLYVSVLVLILLMWLAAMWTCSSRPSGCLHCIFGQTVALQVQVLILF